MAQTGSDENRLLALISMAMSPYRCFPRCLPSSFVMNNILRHPLVPLAPDLAVNLGLFGTTAKL